MEERIEKTLRGYKVIIIILAALLASFAILYFLQINELMESRAHLTVQRDTLASRLSGLIVDFDNLQTENDTLNASIKAERSRADSIMQNLLSERRISASKIRQLEASVATLQNVARGFVNTIDSLHTVNRSLANENVQLRRNEANLIRRAEMAEEREQELDIKVRKGSSILARNINLVAINNRDNEVNRAARATSLRTDFVLTANELATPGPRDVYVRILDPDGYLLSGNSASVFEFEGERLAYSAVRPVDYQNRDFDVSVFYNGDGFRGGKYSVQVYMEGRMIGSNEIILR